jgi:glutaredoxin
MWYVPGFLLVLAASAALAQTNVYRWTDKDGKVHFSDTPPPEEVKGVTEKRMGAGSPDDLQVPFATQLAAKRNPVTLFVTGDCGTPCDQARSLLARRGIPFSQRDARASQAEMDELRKQSADLEVPVLTVGQAKVKGFDEDTWNAAFDAAGYSRTRLPGAPPPPPAAPPPPPAPLAAPPGPASAR